MSRLSVLDLSPIAEGSTAADSFRNSLSLARHAERLGYQRYWLAEHHGMPGIASAATAVLLSHIGSGGLHGVSRIMRRNFADGQSRLQLHHESLGGLFSHTGNNGEASDIVRGDNTH